MSNSALLLISQSGLSCFLAPKGFSKKTGRPNGFLTKTVPVAPNYFSQMHFTQMSQAQTDISTALQKKEHHVSSVYVMLDKDFFYQQQLSTDPITKDAELKLRSELDSLKASLPFSPSEIAVRSTKTAAIAVPLEILNQITSIFLDQKIKLSFIGPKLFEEPVSELNLKSCFDYCKTTPLNFAKKSRLPNLDLGLKTKWVIILLVGAVVGILLQVIALRAN